MKVLVGYTIASIVGAFLAVRIFEYIVGGAVSSARLGVAKATIFVTTWTAITAGSGMRDFSKRVRSIREKTRSANTWLQKRR